MTEGDMPRGEFLRRLGGMLALNFASVLAMTSPLWLTTAFRRANTYWTIAVDPSAPPEEVEAKMRRFRTPPLSEALWRDAALVALPYVAWAVVLHLVHGAFHRPRSRSDRLDHWAAAGRFRLAYMLFWPVPFFGLLMVAFVDDFLLAALRPSGSIAQVLRDVWRWFVRAWLPTMPILMGIGVFLAVRGVRRNLRRWRRQGRPVAVRRARAPG